MIGIQLVSMVVIISLVSNAVWIALISMMIQLRLRMCMSGYPSAHVIT